MRDASRRGRWCGLVCLAALLALELVEQAPAAALEQLQGLDLSLVLGVGLAERADLRVELVQAGAAAARQAAGEPLAGERVRGAAGLVGDPERSACELGRAAWSRLAWRAREALDALVVAVDPEARTDVAVEAGGRAPAIGGRAGHVEGALEALPPPRRRSRPPGALSAER